MCGTCMRVPKRLAASVTHHAHPAAVQHGHGMNTCDYNRCNLAIRRYCQPRPWPGDPIARLGNHHGGPSSPMRQMACGCEYRGGVLPPHSPSLGSTNASLVVPSPPWHMLQHSYSHAQRTVAGQQAGIKSCPWPVPTRPRCETGVVHGRARRVRDARLLPFLPPSPTTSAARLPDPYPERGCRLRHPHAPPQGARLLSLCGGEAVTRAVPWMRHWSLIRLRR